MTDLPLSGLRVVDCATLFAGPLIATLMADFGADVIKVEHPRGDPMRSMGWLKDGTSLWWAVAARNKRCITMNLSHPDGQSVFKELINDADVLVENFRPGTLERWGISPEALHEINPGLVVVRTTGFGQDGPYASRPGFGTLAEAMSGFANINGWPDKPPALPPFALGDGVAALAGTFSAMFALWWRDHGGNGQGQVVDLAIYEPLFWILGPQASVYDQLGEVQGRSGNSTPFSAPRNVYRASDGKWLALSASTQSIAERVMRIIGRDDYLAEPWFADHEGRLAHVDELDEAIQDWIGRHTSAEVLEAFSFGEAAIAQVYSIRDIVQDPHVLARHSLVRVPHPLLGSVLMQNMIARLSVTPGSVRSAGAALGEHNREVLGSLGLTEEDLTHLAEAGVIATPEQAEQVQPSTEGLAI
jgi:crotonobetainyl-CoA:carnitine CoA-transferase CaiB-like acyl-CoA transferase